MRALGFILPLLLPVAASAQVIHGVVTDQATGQPIRGAFVVLEEPNGRARVGILSDAAGRFTIRAPAPGTYSVRAQQIGYGSVTLPPLALQAGATQALDIALPVSALKLPEVSVRGERRCGLGMERAVETARLWEEARKALTVAAWLEQSEGAQFRVRSFEHQLNRALQPQGHEQMSFDRLSGRNAFGAAPADSLLQFGFVQNLGGTFAFFGPDAELLTTSAFLEQHCFWVERRNDRPGLVGLAFEPVRGRRTSDIKGTLWLDQRNGALRFVEYDFVNLGFSVDRRFAGGRTDYKQLPNGAWLVSHWEIRMPIGSAVAGQRVNPDGVQRVGGEVLDALLPGGEQLALVPSFTVRGTAFDSIRNEPLARARITLAGTPLAVLTDDAGEFRFDSVPRGEYFAALSHPRADSLPVPAPALRIRVDSVLRPIFLSTPGLARTMDELCPRSAMIELAVRQERVADELGFVRVNVADLNTGQPLQGVKVTVGWLARLPGGAGAGPRSLQSTTNARGEANICGVPANTEFRVLLEHNRRTTQGPIRTLPPERLLQLSVKLDPASSQ